MAENKTKEKNKKRNGGENSLKIMANNKDFTAFALLFLFFFSLFAVIDNPKNRDNESEEMFFSRFRFTKIICYSLMMIMMIIVMMSIVTIY